MVVIARVTTCSRQSDRTRRRRERRVINGETCKVAGVPGHVGKQDVAGHRLNARVRTGNQNRSIRITADRSCPHRRNNRVTVNDQIRARVEVDRSVSAECRHIGRNRQVIVGPTIVRGSQSDIASGVVDDVAENCQRTLGDDRDVVVSGGSREDLDAEDVSATIRVVGGNRQVAGVDQVNVARVRPRHKLRDGCVERIRIGPDAGFRTEECQVCDEILRGISVVKNRAGRRFDSDSSRRIDAAEQNVLGGKDKDLASRSLREGSVGHRDSTGSITVGVTSNLNLSTTQQVTVGTEGHITIGLDKDVLRGIRRLDQTVDHDARIICVAGLPLDRDLARGQDLSVRSVVLNLDRIKRAAGHEQIGTAKDDVASSVDLTSRGDSQSTRTI